MQLVTRSETSAPHQQPASIELVWGDDGRLRLRGDPDLPVRVVRCFPWTAPGSYLSLRDDKGDERAFIADPGELDDSSRDALDRALAEAGFLFTIRAIRQVTEEIEIRVWKVDTAQGPRTFETARDRWPRELPGGGFLIRDVAGDLYYTPDPETLDPKSRSYLWAFVD